MLRVHPKFITFICCVLAVTGLLITFSFNTIGVSPDSISYIEIAKNITAGNGLVNSDFKVVTTWPPLYPTLLSFVSKAVNVEVINAAMYLNILLIIALFILSNTIFKLLQIKNIKHLLGLNAFILVAPAFQSFLMVWSEPLFYVVLLCAIVLFINYLQTRKLYYIISTSILLAILVLTRYAGIGFVGAFVIFILCFDSLSLQHKFKNLIIFFLPISITLIGWLLYLNSIQVESITTRTFFFHLTSWLQFEDFIYTFSHWLFPFSRPKSYILTSFLFLILIYTKVFSFKKFKAIYKSKIQIQFFIVLIVGYIVFLFTSNLFFDATTPLENRMLSPIYIVLLLTLFFYFKAFSYKKQTRQIITIAIGVIITAQLVSYTKYRYNFSKYGKGYSSKLWSSSKLVAMLPTLKHQKIYTNGNDVFTFFYSSQQQHIQPLPKKTEAIKASQSLNYNKELKTMLKDIDSNKAVIVYFTSINWRTYYPTSKEVLALSKNYTVEVFNDGFIIKN